MINDDPAVMNDDPAVEYFDGNINEKIQMVSEHLISTSNRGSVYGATIVSAVDPLHERWGVWEARVWRVGSDERGF